jgi:protein MpaA
MASALVAVWSLSVLLAPQPNQRVIGHSAEQRAIVTYHLGSGYVPVVIVGGIHGAYEANTSWLVWELLHYYEDNPHTIPKHLRLVFLPEANPDGLANGYRELANGVDANRNWPTADWTTASWEPGFVLNPQGGGLEPLSEPETIALADLITATQPIAVLSYHSSGGLVMGGQHALQKGLARAYLDAAPDYVYHEWSSYPVTGDFAQWCENQGMATVEVELLDHADPDVEQSLAGVQAVLDHIESMLTTDTSY